MFSPGTFRSRFHEYSHTHGLFGERDVVIAAASGGMDSMVLLDLLVRERGLRVVVAHFNHQLRGLEADGDEAFVSDRAREYGVALHVDRADTAAEARGRRLGVQETARNLRYDFLQRVRGLERGSRIATAHHADDNAETVLLHLFRGTGVQGMTGIPILRAEDGIVRPLLFARQEEIAAYAREEEIPYRNDSSNENDGYTRNALRHQILPLLKELIGPAVAENINRSAQHFQSVAEFLALETSRAFDTCAFHRADGAVGLSLARLTGMPDLLRQYVVIAAVERVVGSKPEDVQVRAALDLLGKTAGSRVSLPDGCEVLREREELVFLRPSAENAFSIRVEPNGEYRVAGFRFSSTVIDNPVSFGGSDGMTEYVDADRITAQGLVFRSWQNGDAFIPLGMSARKKVSDFFVDEKIPLHEKRLFPILETADGDVVWVCGRRIDDRFKITAATRRVLKLEFSSTTDR